jgi:pyruvate, water dikinase
MTTEPDDTAIFASDPSRERAKELRCLYSVSDLMESPDLSVADVLAAVAERIPEGWQHPELCRARITVGELRRETEGFSRTPWVQRAPITVRGKLAGEIEVAYVQAPPGGANEPFLLEEQKLVHTIGRWLGRFVESRQPVEAGGETDADRSGTRRSKPEWRIILDLLKETDSVLWRRMLRRLMNHLSKQGVPGVQRLIMQFDPAAYANRDRDSRGSNQPLPKRDVEVVNRVFEEIIRVASITLLPDDLTVLLKQWMRQDKFGFLALATEQGNLDLATLAEIVNRFCRSAQEGESALAPSDDLNARVALSRRFLTDRLSFIAAAKEYLNIHDFGRLLGRVVGPPRGTGKIGGKAAGLFLAEHILKRDGRGNPLIERVRVPHTWFVTSDGLFAFVDYNSLQDTQSVKYRSIEEVRQGYPYLEQIFKHSFFPHDMVTGLKIALDDLGDWPLIVRSSSLLEDSEGSAFSGKYRSLFLANTGSKEERLAALTDAIAEVYASIFGPDPIQYRRERGLLDFMEEMGVLIQRVVGTRVGNYFLPAFAGVAMSNNEFRWSPRIRREDGIIRLVAGLGTRAVDRVGEDYPTLVAPGQPGLRINVSTDEVLHYSQRYLDALDLVTGRFESPEASALFRQVGNNYPLLDRVVSVHSHGSLRRVQSLLLRPETDDLVITFSGLIEGTDFIPQMKAILQILQNALGSPVDVEFAHDGRHFYILQCRPQTGGGDEQRMPIPLSIPAHRKLFSAEKYVTNAQIAGIRYVVYIDPQDYGRLSSMSDMVSVGEAVSRLNGLLPRRAFILMGPGRWGSRGDITLGVRVTYADISNTAMLVEVARKKGSYVPDLSFGTHFFQDLVEARIRYLALYPDETDIVFNEEFFRQSPNLLGELLPDYAFLGDVVRVIDVPAVSDGCELQVIMDGDKEEALGFLARPGGR